MQVQAIETQAATDARADIVFSGRELRDAVKLLTIKLVERRNTVPILASILFEIAPDGTATLTATDLDMWATITLPANGEASEPGRFAVEARALHSILGKAGKLERLRLTDTGDGPVIMKGGRGEWKLHTYKADEFPMPRDSVMQPESGGAMDRAQFMADLQALAPAMSDEYARENLCGIALQVRSLGGRDRFAMVATDGFMMAAASRDVLPGFEAWGGAIMQRKAVTFMLAADKFAGAGAFTLSQSRQFISAEFGALRIVSKMLGGTYPEWPRAFEAMATPTDEAEPALFPDLLPEWPLELTESLQKAAAGAIEWQGANGGVMGECAGDPGMMWAAMYRTENAGHKRDYETGLSVDVAGDREYPIAITGTKIQLTKEQVAALCGDDLWTVLEFPGADGKPRYVSQWLWDDGATRLLCVGKDGRCPKAGAVREYVTREQVEAALAGDVAAAIEAAAPITIHCEAASAPEMPENCADAAPAPTDSQEMPASDPTPVACEPEPQSADAVDPIAAVKQRLAEIEAILATLSAETDRPKRTPAHERAIRRAWAQRKERRLAMAIAADHLRARERMQWKLREAEVERDKAVAAYNAGGDARRELHKERDDWQGRAQRLETQLQGKAELLDTMHENYAALGDHLDRVAMKRRRAVLKARDLQNQLYAEHRLVDRANDKRRLAEQQAADALAMRDDLKRILADAEQRLAAAEAENAQLWAEIEGLTAPQPALAA